LSTALKLRAKRARELQDALQDAIRVERAMRDALAPVVNKWRAAYKRINTAAARFNSMVEGLDEDLVVNVDEVPSPTLVLELVRGAVNLEVQPALKRLREIGPELRKLPTGKKLRAQTRRARATATREREKLERSKLEQERERLRQAIVSLERRLSDPAELEMYRLDRNLMQRTERQPEFSPEEYRDVTRGYLEQTREALRKLG
jgi:predicted  nucleic acid-binding Zn-ribbon protein